MEVVKKGFMTSTTPNWWADVGCGYNLEEVLMGGVPTTCHPEEKPQEDVPVRSKMRFLDSDAKDLFLCKNGEILFRVEE